MILYQVNELKLNSRNSSKYYVYIIIIILAVLYFKTSTYELIFLDDDTLIYEKFTYLQFIEKIETSFTTNYLEAKYYRPVTLLTLIVDEEIGGKTPFIYHLTNFLIHLLTCLILYYVIRRMNYDATKSILAALFFAINPIHINAVGWIAGRGDLLAGFFSISAFYIFLQFIDSKRLVLIIPITFTLLLGILSKEVVLLVPFLFIVYYLIQKKEFTLNKNTTGLLLLLISVLGIYYLLRGLLQADVHITKFSFTTYYRNILVLPVTISKVFIPIGIKALPGIELTTALIGLIVLTTLIFLPIVIKVNKLLYYFGFTWFVMLMLPGMVFRTMGQDGFFYWDCRSYLPMIGIAIIAAELFSQLELNKSKTWAYTAIIIYFLILSTITFVKIDLYKNPHTFWNSVISDYPDRFLPHVALYNYNIHIKDSEQAEKELLIGINKNPTASLPRKMLVTFYVSNDKKGKAFLSVNDALEHINIDQQFFIDKFISLSIETDNIAEIEYLLSNYPENKCLTERINASLKRELERLNNAGDTERAEELRRMLLN